MKDGNLPITLTQEIPINYINTVYESLHNNLYRNIYLWSNGEEAERCSEDDKLYAMFVGGVMLAQYQMAFWNEDKEISERYLNDAWRTMCYTLKKSMK